MNQWEFTKTAIVGYGVLYNPQGKKYNVQFDNKGNIIVTTIKQCRIFKVSKKIEDMIKKSILNGGITDHDN